MFRFGLIAAAAAALCVSTPATAGTLLVHADGLFTGDKAGETVSDVPFVVDLSFDVDPALLIFDPLGGAASGHPGQHYIRGGPGYGLAPIVTGSLTVGGDVIDFSNEFDAQALQDFFVVQQGVRLDASHQLSLIADWGPDPAGLVINVTKPPGGNLCLVATCAASWIAGPYNGPASRIDTYTVTYRGDPVADPAAAPEPATWALLIGGFGAAGASLRRRRAAAA